MRTITDIKRYIAELSPEKKHVFQRLYDVLVETGELSVPAEMESWVEETFGDIGGVESQRIVRITNRMTDEAALFNSLRAQRPIEESSDDVDIDEIVDDHRDGPFASPRTGTPEDSFGRVEGTQTVSASNVAKYDAMHGLVIPDKIDPLSFTGDELKDRFEVADSWFDHASDERHRYPFLMWNCLWKSGASIVHGHMQLLVAKDRPYQRIDALERSARTYQDTFGDTLYEDVFEAHRSIGLDLAVEGVDAFAHLTPRKEKEVVLVDNTVSESLIEGLHEVLRTLIDDLQMRSFNVGIYYPPRSGEEWNLPVIARVVDRGSLSDKTSDMGGMEVYGGENVVASDPYDVMRAFE